MPRLKDRILLALIPRLGSLLIRFLGFTIRFNVEGAPSREEAPRAIYTFWHGRMLMIPIVRNMLYPDDRGPFNVMVSRHRDGEFISRAMHRLNILTTRGSTTRGGMAALKELMTLSRQGHNIVITPDGPRGPRYVAQMGAVQAAKATGLPIYPLTYSTRKKKLLVPGMVL